MEVFEAVRTVLAVRSYRPEPIPEGIKRRILEAGRLSASSMNLQPWHFIMVDSREDLRKLGSMAKTGTYIADAGMAVAVAIESSKYAASDASRAIQNMILTAWAEGLASNWVGYFGLEQAEEFLGIPEHLDLFAIVAIGFSETVSSRGIKDRKPFDEVVHGGRFGRRIDG